MSLVLPLCPLVPFSASPELFLWGEFPGSLAVKDSAMLLLWPVITAVVQVGSLAGELLRAVGVAKKKFRKVGGRSQQ